MKIYLKITVIVACRYELIAVSIRFMCLLTTVLFRITGYELGTLLVPS